jgi:hypothetical protein
MITERDKALKKLKPIAKESGSTHAEPFTVVMKLSDNLS